MKYYNIEVRRISGINDSYIEFLKETNPKGVLIIISSDTTQDELSRFVKNEYQNIKILLGNRKPFHIRDYSHSERDKRIYRVWELYSKKPIKELREIAGKWSCHDKSEAISLILKKDCDIEVKPDHLRTIISRIKKRRGSP